MTRMDRLDEFVDASVRLTGFGRIALLGTGAAEDYLRTVRAVVPPAVLDGLFAAIANIPADEAHDGEIATSIMADPTFAPVAKNIIVLWYCGTWQQMPDDWRAAHQSVPADTTHVVSANAYLSGLQWTVVGAHPPGGAMQGFGAWSLPPAGDAS